MWWWCTKVEKIDRPFESWTQTESHQTLVLQHTYWRTDDFFRQLRNFISFISAPYNVTAKHIIPKSEQLRWYTQVTWLKNDSRETQPGLSRSIPPNSNKIQLPRSILRDVMTNTPKSKSKSPNPRNLQQNTRQDKLWNRKHPYGRKHCKPPNHNRIFVTSIL